MRGLRFTLVTDGPSDVGMLAPILEWLLRIHCSGLGIDVAHADPLRCREVPRGLASRVAFALAAYPCDCLFIHRDAERESPEVRRREIQDALGCLGKEVVVPHICVIPIRMTEAWLLFDETAIRRAAGNPNGKVRLDIPAVSSLEGRPDPKRLLHELLTEASELSGRRRRSFDPRNRVQRVAQLLEDFSPLRGLSAFRQLESDVQQLVLDQQWDA